MVLIFLVLMFPRPFMTFDVSFVVKLIPSINKQKVTS